MLPEPNPNQNPPANPEPSQPPPSRDGKSALPEGGEPRKYAGKYESPDALEKGYNELFKQHKELRDTYSVPEKYAMEFDKIPELKDFKPDDPVLQKMLPVFKELGVSQKQFEGLLKQTYKMAQEIIPSYDPKAEVTKLGEKGKEIVSKLATFAEQTFADEKERNVFRSMCMTAEECNVMFKLIGLDGERPIPGKDGQPPRATQTASEAYDSWIKYRNDNAKRLGSDPEITKEEARLRRVYVEIKDKEKK